MATSVNTATATATPTKIPTTTFCLLLQKQPTMHEWAFDCHLIEYPMRTSTDTIVRTTFSSPFTSGWQKHKWKHRQQHTHSVSHTKKTTTKEKTKRHATHKILSDKCFVFINFQTTARTISARRSSDRNQIQFMLWNSWNFLLFFSRSEFLTFSFPLNNSVRIKYTMINYAFGGNFYIWPITSNQFDKRAVWIE